MFKFLFIDLDDTTVTREIQNEGARTWSAVLTVLTMIGIAGTIVFFVLRRKSAAAEKEIFPSTSFLNVYPTAATFQKASKQASFQSISATFCEKYPKPTEEFSS